jgi:hypothetical protein
LQSLGSRARWVDGEPSFGMASPRVAGALERDGETP